MTKEGKPFQLSLALLVLFPLLPALLFYVPIHLSPIKAIIYTYVFKRMMMTMILLGDDFDLCGGVNQI